MKKRVSKLFAVILAFLIIVPVTLLSVVAESPSANCSITGAKYDVGATDSFVTANVSFTSDKAFAAGMFTVVAEGLELVDCTVAQSIGGDEPVIILEATQNKVMFTGFGMDAEDDFRAYTELTLILKFTLVNLSLSDAAAGTSWSVGVQDIDLVNIAEEEYAVETSSGTIEVIFAQPTHIAGDVNGDGSVNNKDLTRLFQYLSDWEVEVDENALDINGDGSINNKDLTRLFQYLSDWDVQIH